MTLFERLWTRAGGVPGTREIRVLAAAVLIAALLFTIAAAALDARGVRFGTYTFGADFTLWYATGRIMNEYPHARIYDEALQLEMQRKVAPHLNGVLPYGRAPFLALLFQPLAKLPYVWAYALWTAVSIGLYLAGLYAVLPRGAESRSFAGTAFWLAVSFPPFIIENLAGGQISSIAFLGFAACIALERSGRDFAAGMALCLCANKPTLLVLALPMALFSGRLRLLAGFAAGSCAAGALSLYAVGAEGCAAWFRLLTGFAAAATGGRDVFRLFKYVDVNSFLRLLFRGGTSIGTVLSAAVSVAGFAWLSIASWRWRKRGGSRDLLWAATLAWTLVVGAYTPIYDVILIVLSAVLAAGALRNTRDIGPFAALAGMVYLAAWLTQPMAQAAGLQIITPLLAGAGVFAVKRCVADPKPPVRAGCPSELCGPVCTLPPTSRS